MKIIIEGHEGEISLKQLKKIVDFFNEEDFDVWIEGIGNGRTRLVIERKFEFITLNNCKEVYKS